MALGLVFARGLIGGFGRTLIQGLGRLFSRGGRGGRAGKFRRGAIHGLTFDEKAMLNSPEVREAVNRIAGSISREANQTSAPIGITYHVVSEDPYVVRIGPRGKAAIAVEFGHRNVPGRRLVKKAIDKHRIG